MLNNKRNGIPFDGFGQVEEMLQKADRAFREKMIRNIAAKDPALAQRILAATSSVDMESSFDQSERLLAERQRTLNVRTYGR